MRFCSSSQFQRPCMHLLSWLPEWFEAPVQHTGSWAGSLCQSSVNLSVFFQLNCSSLFSKENLSRNLSNICCFYWKWLKTFFLSLRTCLAGRQTGITFPANFCYSSAILSAMKWLCIYSEIKSILFQTRVLLGKLLLSLCCG